MILCCTACSRHIDLIYRNPRYAVAKEVPVLYTRGEISGHDQIWSWSYRVTQLGSGQHRGTESCRHYALHHLIMMPSSHRHITIREQRELCGRFCSWAIPWGALSRPSWPSPTQQQQWSLMAAYTHVPQSYPTCSYTSDAKHSETTQA